VTLHRITRDGCEAPRRWSRFSISPLKSASTMATRLSTGAGTKDAERR
jgi:hypothetical protein